MRPPLASSTSGGEVPAPREPFDVVRSLMLAAGARAAQRAVRRASELVHLREYGRAEEAYPLARGTRGA